MAWICPSFWRSRSRRRCFLPARRRRRMRRWARCRGRCKVVCARRAKCCAFPLEGEGATVLAMVDLPKPEVICTHESDLDGLVSGILLQRLAAKLFGEPPRLEAYHNHNWRQRGLPEKSAWVCDLMFEPRL